MKEKSNKKMMILSFIGIIMVVIGHTNEQLDFFNNVFIYYSFHMPLFIFISGYFYKESYESDLKSFVWSKFKKLVIPYFAWNIIYAILLVIIKHLHLVNFGDQINLYSLFVRPWIDGHQFHLNIASWFMLSLFTINILYIVIRTISRKIKIWNDWVALIIFFIIAVLSIKFSAKIKSDYMIPILRVMFFMFFYQFGLMYKKFEGKLRINILIKLVVLIVLQLALLKIDPFISYRAVFMSFHSKFIVTPVIASITGIVFWANISEMLVPSLKDNKIVNYISAHTKEIMFHHIFWIFVINTIIKLVSSPLSLSGFDNEQYMSTVYYIYTADIPQLAILYTILCITMPLLFHYIYEKYILKLISAVRKKIKH